MSSQNTTRPFNIQLLMSFEKTVLTQLQNIFTFLQWGWILYLSISWISPEGLFPSRIQPAQAKAYEKTIALLQTALILIIALFFLRVEMRQELQYIDSFDKKKKSWFKPFNILKL